MPENPFTKYQKYIDRPGRSSKDLSYDINGTYRLGTLYPAGIWDVHSGDSFQIESAFGLKFVPMPYPIQTRLRANLYYYYVRNRNIYDGWKDFIYNNKPASEVPHPYITRPATDRDFWKTGGIMDHLGCPTTVVRPGDKGEVTVSVWGLSVQSSNLRNVGHSTSLSEYPLANVFGNSSASTVYVYPSYVTSPYRNFTQSVKPVFLWNFFRPKCFAPGSEFPTIHESVLGLTYSQCRLNGLWSQLGYDSDYSDADPYMCIGYNTGVFFHAPEVDSVNGRAILTFHNCVPPSNATFESPRNMTIMVFAGDVQYANGDGDGASKQGWYGMTAFKCVYSHRPEYEELEEVPAGWVPDGSTEFQVSLPKAVCDACTSAVAEGKQYFLFVGESFADAALKESFFVNPYRLPLYSNSSNLGDCCSMGVVAHTVVDLGDYPAMNPHAGANPVKPLSALPLRVYESIYNAWFRNERLEPLLINGVPEYNKFCPNTSDGADNFAYKLHQRNWESDFLTTALPTPQQGVAPVVGVTGLSNIQIDDDGRIVTFKAQVGDDGETIVGGSFHDPDVSQAATRTVQELVTAGFTINDFRNVNALQRWLENNLRRGLKYRDQVLANTGVKVGYDELDMPEFIGGYSRPVQVGSITQTAPGGDVGVGDYFGQASCFGGSSHKITHFCDEAGFIMAVLCIVPEPVYSQLLPKYFLRSSPLDYFHPSFNHIGMQPITYAEVCPLQVYAKNPSQDRDNGIVLDDVFGYQRPWYELCARVNEVHGLMRTTMRNYVMNRTFDDVPELGADFIHIDPRQINDVFSVTLPDEDVCMGQIIHRCYCKNQVSLFGQPKIQ